MTRVPVVFSVRLKRMAENIPNLPGPVVPPKKETGKVQPKKETVRINLPPKPTAAPTIKLPTLPPGGATAAAAPQPAAPAPTAAAPVAPPRTSAAAPTASSVKPVAAPAAKPTAPAPRPVAVSAALSPLDKGLAIAAAVVGLLAAGSVAFLLAL